LHHQSGNPLSPQYVKRSSLAAQNQVEPAAYIAVSKLTSTTPTFLGDRGLLGKGWGEKGWGERAHDRADD
jgi:hypothetical protein